MNPKTFISDVRQEAKKLKKTVVLPDALDPRTIRAARVIVDEAIANPILIGDEVAIITKAAEEKISLAGITIVDPVKSDKLASFTELYYN
ncbi:MAG: phosphate acyltransferase, partial [Ignavibacteriales bacterium]|nr:phosphate acyltransferase [Ignavibacteriales bacterium]